MARRLVPNSILTQHIRHTVLLAIFALSCPAGLAYEMPTSCGEQSLPGCVIDITGSSTRDNFRREFCSPRHGCFFRIESWSRTDAKDLLAPSDYVVWCDFVDTISFVQPYLYVQLTSGMSGGRDDRIQSMAVNVEDGPALAPWIDKTYHASLQGNTFSILAKLPALEHLELYDLWVEGHHRDFQDVENLKELIYLGLPADANDRELLALGSLAKLRFLNASGTRVTGSGIAGLGPGALTMLDLRYSALEGQNLRHFQNLSQLQTLLLSGTTLTNADLRFLLKLSSLEVLTLDDTMVTASGLSHLAGLRNLRWISARGIEVSKAQAAQLSAQLPGVIVEVDAPPRLSPENRPLFLEMYNEDNSFGRNLPPAMLFSDINDASAGGKDTAGASRL
jgi:hypothetical protein